ETRVRSRRADVTPQRRIRAHEEGYEPRNRRTVDGRLASLLAILGGRDVDNRLRTVGVGQQESAAHDRLEITQVGDMVDALVDALNRRSGGAGYPGLRRRHP